MTLAEDHERHIPMHFIEIDVAARFDSRRLGSQASLDLFRPAREHTPQIRNRASFPVLPTA